MKPYYKSFIWKLYIVVGLCVLIMCCMFYLIFTGADVRIRAAYDNADSEVEPDETPSPSPEVTPDESADPEPSATPETTPEPSETPELTPTPSPSAQPTPTPSATPSPTPSAQPTPSPTPSAQPTPTTSPDPYRTEFDTETTESMQKLINRSHTVSPSYVPNDLRVPNVPVYKNQAMRAEAASAMEKMFAAAAADGYQLYLASGYRSYAEQMEIYENYVKERGKKEADRIDAHPSASEHQLGLGADLCTTDGGCAFSTCFDERPEYTWLRENAWKYGYIERYPQGKEQITRIKYSPWHYRYVGKDLAEEMVRSGLCFEEFFKQSAYE